MTKSDKLQSLIGIPGILKRLSIALAATIALLPPMGYWIISYHNESDQLKQHAEQISHTVSKIAYLNPNGWDLQLHRLEHIVEEFRPRNLEVNISIQDKSGYSLLNTNKEQLPLALSRNSPIMSNDGMVGGVRLEKSLANLVYRTIYIALICLVVAFSFLGVIFRYAIRGIQSATSEIKQAHKNLEKQQMYLDGILHSPKNVAIVAADRSWIIQYFNKVAEQLFGCPSHEALGSPLYELHNDLQKVIGEIEKAGQSVVGDAEFSFMISEGVGARKRYIEAQVSTILDVQNQPSGYTLICTDITEKQRASELIQYQAMYDTLTDLPNRRFFKEQLSKALAQGKRHDYLCAVLFLDLDSFKNINDSLGHSIGDMLLQEVAKRLKSHLREEDFVARLGGDEFVVLLLELSDATKEAIDNARKLAEKLRITLSEPYTIGPHTLHVTPSIGISIFPNGTDKPEDIMQQADKAMYRAKEAGRNTLKFFLPSMQRAANDRLRVLGDLRHGIDCSEFLVFFQPQFDVNRELVGAEALVRWQHPKRGLVPPNEFITLAEESGLILELGEVVLGSALATLRLWQMEGMVSPLFRISVNISPQQFKQVKFVHWIESTLGKTSVEPVSLTLEMTEGVLLENIDSATEKILALKDIGVRFSIDDFGTGYSSLAYLKRLPVDEIKIDHSFIRDILVDDSDAALVEAIVSLSSRLNLDTVAEGVETQDQYEYLQKLGCKVYQGYLLSKPLSSESFRDYLISRKSEDIWGQSKNSP